MNRTALINHLISLRNYKSYLEIGLNCPDHNYNHIVVDHKECVDPYGDYEFKDRDDYSENNLPDDIKAVLTYHMTSDEMFEKMPMDKKFDIIFIDGLHQAEQVLKDAKNSLLHLNEGGIILMHDCLPIGEEFTHFPRTSNGIWYGSTWKVIPTLKKAGLQVYVYNDDCGIGILPYQDFSSYPSEILNVSYSDYFNENFKENLNVIFDENI